MALSSSTIIGVGILAGVATLVLMPEICIAGIAIGPEVSAAIVAGLFVPVSFRSLIWIIALIWMGTACMLNARRCNRTHCRYTGPYYLAMIVPVFVLSVGVVSAGIYGWISLGVFIVGGSGLIWWATERTWGKFS